MWDILINSWLKKSFVSIILLLLVFFNFQSQAKTVYLKKHADIIAQLSQPNIKYILRYDYDLGGDTLQIGSGNKLVFRGGSIRNGVIIGDNTIIKASAKSEIFHNVHIEGTWKCPKIYSTWLADRYATNKIQDIISLSSNDINNKILIDSGVYHIAFSTDSDASLKLKSNTILKIEGTLRVLKNSLSGYYTIYLKNVDNVVIEGPGKIEGDKEDHCYDDDSTNEWGHGILVSNSSNIKIQNLSLTNFIGDGICVWDHFSPSCNIIIDGCFISGCRRQGISICDAVDYTIKNCAISDISGTSPEYAIDIEPDKGDAHICRNGVIRNNTIKSKNGVYVQTNPSLGTESINISSNDIDAGKYGIPITISGGESIIIDSNLIHGLWGVVITPVNIIKSITICKNTIKAEGGCIYNCGKQVQDHLIVTNNNLYGTLMSNGKRLLFTNNVCEGEVLAIHADSCIIRNNVINSNLEVKDGCVITDNKINGCVTIGESELSNNRIIGLSNQKGQHGGIITIDGGAKVLNNMISFSELNSKLSSVFNIRHNCLLKNNSVDNSVLYLMAIDNSVSSIVSEKNTWSNQSIYGNAVVVDYK